MSKKTFGLDIGAVSIKVVSLESENGIFRLRSALTSPAPPKGMLSESPLDQEEMATAIKHVVEQAKIDTPYVNVALPENQVYTKVIEMPLLSEHELSSAIYWEAEQHIPVPLESVTLDWHILHRPTLPQEGNVMQVLLVGAPTLLIQKYNIILSEAGLMINAVETEVLSVIRCVVGGPDFPTSIIVHIGALTTSLAIIKGGVVVFAYHIAAGGAALSRAIASDFGFSVTEAEAYKKTYGVSSENLGGKIGDSAKPVLMAIISEIKKAIVFYTDKFKAESPVQQLILSGGTAKLPDVDLFFAQNSGMETVIVDPWKNLANKTEIPKEILDNGADYVIAVGLAMRAYE